jgi:hypothetical protein
MKTTISKILLTVSTVFLFLGLAVGTTTTGTTSNPKVSYFFPEPNQINGDTYQLLIITPTIFKDELQPLVIHKKSIGMSTKLVKRSTTRCTGRVVITQRK